MASADRAPTSSDEHEVRSVVESYAMLRAGEKVDALVSLFTSDGTLLYAGHPPINGTRQLLAHFDADRVPWKVESFHVEDVSVRGDVASVRATSTGMVFDVDLGEEKETEWRNLISLRRVKETWLIAECMFRPVG